jgi:hypothetical protein
MVTYCKNGFVHRNSKEGPAYQIWDWDGNLIEKEYWENGERVPEPIACHDATRLL